VELYRSCVKGIETGFKPLRQPSRFVTFSTVQKVLFSYGNYLIIYNYVHYNIHYIYMYINTQISPFIQIRLEECGLCLCIHFVMWIAILGQMIILFPVQFSPL